MSVRGICKFGAPFTSWFVRHDEIEGATVGNVGMSYICAQQRVTVEEHLVDKFLFRIGGDSKFLVFGQSNSRLCESWYA